LIFLSCFHSIHSQNHILALFKEFHKKGEALSAQVLASKADTVGAGKNLIDAMLIEGTHSPHTLP